MQTVIILLSLIIIICLTICILLILFGKKIADIHNSRIDNQIAYEHILSHITKYLDAEKANRRGIELVEQVHLLLQIKNLQMEKIKQMAYQNSSVFNRSALDDLILIMSANDHAEVVAGSDTDEKITDSSVAFELALNTSDFTNQDKRFLNKDKVQAYIDKCDSESVSTFTVKCKNLSSNNLNDGATNIYFDIGTSLNNNLLPDAI